MIINSATIQSGTGCDAITAAKWLPCLRDAMEQFHIDTPKKAAAFLANIGVESAGLSVLEENLHYSAKGLAATWPDRYSINGKPNAKAIKIANDPMAIANDCYANRMGNRDAASGDGWRYRGMGLIQITGFSNHHECSVATGLDITKDPNIFTTMKGAAMSAAWFFFRHGLNILAEQGNFAAVVKGINGQNPCDANQGKLRTARLNLLLAQLPA